MKKYITLAMYLRTNKKKSCAGGRRGSYRIIFPRTVTAVQAGGPPAAGHGPSVGIAMPIVRKFRDRRPISRLSNINPRPAVSLTASYSYNQFVLINYTQSNHIQRSEFVLCKRLINYKVMINCQCQLCSWDCIGLPRQLQTGWLIWIRNVLTVNSGWYQSISFGRRYSHCLSVEFYLRRCGSRVIGPADTWRRRWLSHIIAGWSRFLRLTTVNGLHAHNINCTTAYNLIITLVSEIQSRINLQRILFLIFYYEWN